MFISLKSPIILGLLVSLSACGGGSSDSGAETPTIPDTTPPPVSPSNSEMIKNATQYTSAQLETAVKSLTEERYLGSKASTDIDIILAQELFKNLFNLEMQQLPDLALEYFAANLDSNRNIDVTASCYSNGTVSFKGGINSSGQGNVEISYNACQNLVGGVVMSGRAAFSVQEPSDYDSELTFYFDNLHWIDERGTLGITGYLFLSDKTNSATGQSTQIADQQLLYSVGQEQRLVETITTETYWGEQPYSLSLSGNFYDSTNGKVAIETDGLTERTPDFINGSISFTGTNKVEFEFDYNHIKYVEDNNNDGTFDLGTYFSGMTELLNGTVTGKTLVALTKMSLPPVVAAPGVISYDIDTTKPIVLHKGWYEDPDTPTDELSVSFRWYINDELVANESSDTLPAYTAVFGDEVKATMVVADSSNIIEGAATFIHIKDAPAEIRTTDIPDTIKAGDIVQFSVMIFDPDLLDETNPGNLISAPAGATIDTNGIVTWVVSNDFLFSYQSFEFTFGITDANGNIIEKITVSIDATSDKPFPITRSGIEVPAGDKSMWVGDYDGDGLNEVLTTDNLQRVFLLESKGESYEQKWLYPFAMPTKGNITQVLSHNINADAKEEIIVVTNYGISVIDGLDNLATELLSTEHYIRQAAIADIDGDGIPEIAYLYDYMDYSSTTVKVSVFSLNDPSVELFNADFENAQQIIFANVDKDENIELVSNNGLVYDTSSWENQWFSGTAFGDRFVTAGDYNGDGIDEIAGASSWGEVTIYSAVDKSQIASFETFNNCTVQSANLDDDPSDELLIGDCQWGEIHAYDLIGNSLSEKWNVALQGHGSTSLTIADSDNDGLLEAHWGTGTTSSGEDGFVVADITNTSATLKAGNQTPQLDSFTSAGWSNIIQGKERAVFFIPSTDSGYGDSRVLTMDNDGSFELSEPISSNWDSSTIAVTTDYNHDGFGDIFMPTSQNYDGSFSVLQLFDYSVHWQLDGDYDSNIGVIKAFDINNDGFDDANYSDSNKLKVIDIVNQNIIATYSFEQNISDFISYHDGNTVSIVSHGEKLSLMTLAGSAFSEKSFIDQDCHRLEMFNFDTDEQLELLCLVSNDSGSSYSETDSIVVFEIENFNLVEQARYSFNSRIIDIAIDPATSSEQALFVVIQKEDSSGYWDHDSIYTIKKLDANGNTIWTGPGLVGYPAEHGLKVRYDAGHQIMLSTSEAMYLIHQLL